MADISRIEREMNYLTTSENVPVTKVERIDGKNLEWKVIFEGPEASAYEDGIFTLKFVFPQNYPTGGPEALFITPMFHPNVRVGDQHVCINLLNSWDPQRTIEDVILGIIDIMINPSTIGAYGNPASTLLGQDPDAYYDKVEEYTYQHAKKAL
jgi:ubiquitin-conjugating enzyme E2 I